MTGVLTTDTIDKSNDTERQQKFGGVGVLERIGKTVDEPYAARRRPGSWAGFINDKFPAAEVLRLGRAAFKAGLVGDTLLDRVRLVALAGQSAKRPTEHRTGCFISHVELGDWDALDPSEVKTALRLLKADTITVDAVRQPRIH